MKALPSLARAVSSSPDAYVYLAESIRAWPDQRGLAARIEAAGWSRPEWRNLSGGIVALHRATERPASGSAPEWMQSTLPSGSRNQAAFSPPIVAMWSTVLSPGTS